MEETKKVVLNNWQKTIWFDQHRFTTLCIGRRGGKALAIDTPILTHDGWKTMGTLNLNDLVFDEKGNAVEIEYISPLFLNHDCFEVEFSNGEKIIADAEHLWSTEDKKYRKNIVRNKYKILEPLIKTTRQLSLDFKVKRTDTRNEFNYAIRKCDALDFHNRYIFILHPYLLGLWLGDGTTNSPEITVTEQEIKDKMENLNVTLKQKGTHSIVFSMNQSHKFNSKLKRQKNGTSYRDILKGLGVLGNKHIPTQYLYSNIDDRKQLLMGLMDTDGTITTSGKCEFSVTNKRLAEDVLFLIRSLGIKANMKECDAKLYGRFISKRYRIIFSPSFNCFLLSYKQNRFRQKRKTDTDRHFIVNIKQVKSVPTKCIMVNSPSHLYLAGNSLIPTHNTTFSALKMADFVSNHANSIVYYVAPTYIQAKNIMWEMLKQYVPKHWIVEKKEQELKIMLANGSRIELKGADSEPDRLRGVRIDYLICDEIAFFRNWLTVWNNVLRPTLMDSKGKGLFISTPNGYNHFYDLYMKSFLESKGYDVDYKSYKFTSYDNNYLPATEVDKARAESDEDTFAQEYMAEFKRYTGLVLKYFKREEHYINPIEIQNHWSFYRGIDFGWTHASACTFIAVNEEGKVYIYDEIKQSNLTNPEFANLIKQKSVGRGFTSTWADSQAASDIKEMNNFGIAAVGVNKSMGGTDGFTKFKVRKLNEKIKAGKFFVFNNCPQTLFEIENWQYKQVTEGNVIREVPAKINDDLMDATAYAVINIPEYFEGSFTQPSNSIYSPPDWANKLPDWSGANRYGTNSYFKKNRG